MATALQLTRSDLLEGILELPSVGEESQSEGGEPGRDWNCLFHEHRVFPEKNCSKSFHLFNFWESSAAHSQTALGQPAPCPSSEDTIRFS